MRLLTSALLSSVLLATQAGTQTRDVEIKAPDGVTLKASYYSPGKPGPGVMLFHMCNSDRTSWGPLAQQLVARGMHVMAWDYRGFGQSGGQQVPRLPLEQVVKVWREDWGHDMRAVHDWFIAQGGVDQSRLAAVGGSCGVFMSLLYAETYAPRVKGAVILAGPSEARLRGFVANTPAFAVLGGASREEAEPARMIQEVVSASKNPHSRMITLERAGHGTDMLGTDKEFAGTVVNWLADRLASQSTRPPRRAHHALVYDGLHQRVLLTGGSTPATDGSGFTFYNDLWGFDGARWSSLASSGDKLSGMQVAFDSNLKRAVSFGGFDERGPRGDLRVLEGDKWRALGTHPTVRVSEPGFVFDSRRGRFVLFGGSPGAGQASGETWELEGERWTRSNSSNPPARQAHVMVFDESRGQTVVFGGMGSGTPPQPPPTFSDTWVFDGVGWSPRKVAGPSARIGAGAAYDSKRRVVVLFGGMGSAGPLGDTWTWNGERWTKVADTGPPARGMGYLAYDTARDRIVLFGGRAGYPNDLDDTWEWDGATWRRVGR